MSKENFAEKMKAAKEAKAAKDAEQAASLNEQIDEKEEAKAVEYVKITSTEIEITSSEFHNFGIVLFEKNKQTFVTDKVLAKLLELPNFKNLVDKGVIKIGM